MKIGMKWICSLWFCLIISGVLAAANSEKSVMVADGVEGKLVTPGNGSQKPDRIVLLYHGWTGKMDEVGDLYKRLAEQLGDMGIASLRIDFRGEGERNGTRLTSTFATRIADGEAALAFAQKNFPKAKVGIVGFSLGGATALAVTGRSPTDIKTLVLWSSSGNLGVDFFGNPGMINGQREAIEKGESTIQSWTEITLTREHLLGFIGYDLLGPMKEYKGALFAVRGTDDFLPRYEDQFLEAASGWREEYLIMSGADHIYHAFEPDSLYDDRLLEATVRFIQETL
jgi:uncharacterized protein